MVIVVDVVCTQYIMPDVVKDWANRLGDPKRMYYFVRDKIKYIDDPFDVWQSPKLTLELMGGDCEDKAILLTSMLIALGYDAWCRIGNVTFYGKVHGKIEKESADHVWILLRDGPRWIELDPSCINCKFGQTAFKINNLIMDFNNKIIYVHDPIKAKKYIIK